MSDRIAVMNNGIIEQIGSPQEIYNNPTTKFVADFIGETNVLEAYVEEVSNGSIQVSLEAGNAVLKAEGFVKEEIVYICVRPENLRFSTEPILNFNIHGKVKEHVFIGSINKTIVELINGQEMKITTQPETELLPVGTSVFLYWNENKGVILHTQEEQIYNLIENTVQIEGGKHV